MAQMLVHADTPEAGREIKTPSNCANRRCHAKGEPQEPVLSEAKDHVVGVRVFCVRTFWSWPFDVSQSSRNTLPSRHGEMPHYKSPVRRADDIAHAFGLDVEFGMS